MNRTYRLRPQNDKTIDELKDSYLWFSKPFGFNDEYDSNFTKFVNLNPIVLKALEQIYTNSGIDFLKNYFKHIGVCCFTKLFPHTKNMHNFPNGRKSICIEYDKEILGQYFLNSNFAMPNCFKDVMYYKKPVFIEQNGEYHYLAESCKEYKLYRSIKELKYHPRYIDKFIFFLLTRIDKKFYKQKEERIILSGKNVQELDDFIRGYKIPIPPEAIRAIYVYPLLNRSFISKLKKIDTIKDKIKYYETNKNYLKRNSHRSYCKH